MERIEEVVKHKAVVWESAKCDCISGFESTFRVGDLSKNTLIMSTLVKKCFLSF